MTHKKNRLVYVRFLDHVLFKNIKEGTFNVPTIRETIGWLVEDHNDYIRLLWERSVKKLPQERSQDRISGMIILKPLILEIREVNLG